MLNDDLPKLDLLSTKQDALSFVKFILQGADAQSFLQGQLTVDVRKLSAAYQACAISNLKGRVAFGLWVCRLHETGFALVVSADCADALQAHLKKYGAFSKFELQNAGAVLPIVQQGLPTFSDETGDLDDKTQKDQAWLWQQTSIAVGNIWITAKTQDAFQPQALRLHQRGGVDYDKGCYLGQEVIARVYFKSAPKSFLHRVKGDKTHWQMLDDHKVEIVNAIACDGQGLDQGFEALVVARFEDILSAGLHILDLPDPLQQSVARIKD